MPELQNKDLCAHGVSAAGFSKRFHGTAAEFVSEFENTHLRMLLQFGLHSEGHASVDDRLWQPALLCVGW